MKLKISMFHSARSVWARGRSPGWPVWVGVAAIGAATLGGSVARGADPITVGYIVKTLNNPYFGNMRTVATAEAQRTGVHLVFEAGNSDNDVSTQISDIEDLTTEGAKAIIIVPSVSPAVVPALERAQKAGVTVIAVDTNIGPPAIANSFIATDNFKGGLADGLWAKAALHGAKPVVALLEGTPASSVNSDRMGGFLQGMGMAQNQAAVDLITGGDQSAALSAMQNALAAHPDINLVWTINEPAAFGAYTAIKNEGLAGKVKIVTMDGSCRGVRGLESGSFDADVMQFPGKMAKEGVDEAIAAAAGKVIPKLVDTGQPLVTSEPQSGVPSIAPAAALSECWG